MFIKLENGDLFNLNKASRISVRKSTMGNEKWLVVAFYGNDLKEYLYEGNLSQCNEFLNRLGESLETLSD